MNSEMNKIPTLFVRDEDNRAHVTREPNPACAWVFAGHGVATRKYDGTCVMYDGRHWWARREVKPGKTAPDGYVLLNFDAMTGKSTGWEPMENSAWLRWHAAAREYHAGRDEQLPPGTYELVGPKVNGNPEQVYVHMLVRHDQAEKVHGIPLDFDGLRERLALFAYEGIVWHHPDGRMAKIKRKDFPGIELEQLNRGITLASEAATRLADAFNAAGKSLAAACAVLDAAQLARDEAMIRTGLVALERARANAGIRTAAAAPATEK